MMTTGLSIPQPLTLGREPWTKGLVSWYHYPRQISYNVGDIRSFWSTGSNDMSAEYWDGTQWVGIDYTIWTSDQTNNALYVTSTASSLTLNGTEI